MSNFKIRFIMIPDNIGGYRGELHNNIRFGIRWQQYINEFVESRIDVSLNKIIFHKTLNIWEAECSSIASIESKLLVVDELIELLGSYNVVGVGKIIR